MCNFTCTQLADIRYAWCSIGRGLSDGATVLKYWKRPSRAQTHSWLNSSRTQFSIFHLNAAMCIIILSRKIWNKWMRCIWKVWCALDEIRTLFTSTEESRIFRRCSRLQTMAIISCEYFLEVHAIDWLVAKIRECSTHRLDLFIFINLKYLSIGAN